MLLLVVELLILFLLYYYYHHHNSRNYQYRYFLAISTLGVTIQYYPRLVLCFLFTACTSKLWCIIHVINVCKRLGGGWLIQYNLLIKRSFSPFIPSWRYYTMHDHFTFLTGIVSVISCVCGSCIYKFIPPILMHAHLLCKL